MRFESGSCLNGRFGICSLIFCTRNQLHVSPILYQVYYLSTVWFCVFLFLTFKHILFFNCIQRVPLKVLFGEFYLKFYAFQVVWHYYWYCFSGLFLLISYLVRHDFWKFDYYHTDFSSTRKLLKPPQYLILSFRNTQIY